MDSDGREDGWWMGFVNIRRRGWVINEFRHPYLPGTHLALDKTIPLSARWQELPSPLREREVPAKKGEGGLEQGFGTQVRVVWNRGLVRK